MPRRLLAVAALGVLFGAPLASAASAQIPSWIGRFMGLGRTGSVMEWVDEQRGLQGPHPELTTIEAAVLTRDARYHEAVARFEEGAQTDWYAKVGLRYHADALRETGQPLAAAQLRADHIQAHELAKAQEFTLHMLRVHDLRFAGHTAEAREAAELLVGMFPLSATAWATLAEVQLDQGDFDGAHVTLDIGMVQSKKGARQVSPTRLRAYLEEGDLWGAQRHMDEVGRRLGGRKSYWVAYLDLQLRLGNPGLVLKQLDRKRWARDASPSLAALRARALWPLGFEAEAHELLRGLLDAYPAHPDVLVAVEALEAAGMRLAP